jgi:uncharacterized protein
MRSFLENHRGEIAALCRQFRVRRLEAFGSAVREDFDPAKSDLDFLVEFAPPHDVGYADRYLALAEGLEKALAHPVDLLTERSLRNPILKRAIAADRRTLYGN